MNLRGIVLALALVTGLWIAPALANGIWGHIESLDPILQRRIQEALVEKDYDPGPIDGKYGDLTLAALVAFRTDNGILEEDDYYNAILDPELAKALFGIDIAWGNSGLEPELQLKVLEQLGLVPTDSYWKKYGVFLDD
jgi:hypothetical protein